MKILLISPKNRTVFNFRGELVRSMVQLGHQVYVTGPDEVDVEKILDLGAKFIKIPLQKNGTNIPEDLKYCYRLYRLMRHIKPDLTLGYTIKPVIYGAIAAKLTGVMDINGMVTGVGYTFISSAFKARVLGKIVSMLYKVGLSCSTHVIFHNSDDRDEFVLRRLVKPGKCRVVNGSGVNMASFSPAPFPERITFFMLSRLLRSKGVLEYLQAAKIVKDKYPDVRFMLLGKYERAMQDALLSEEVELFIREGIVERFDETDNIRPFYSDCSVYVLPSYREGMPRTVLEAMAMGRPIITTDVNGCRDTVVDDKNGFLVPARDVKTIADKMNWFILNPEQIEIIGRESLRICREKFDVRKVNQDMLIVLGIENKQ